LDLTELLNRCHRDPTIPKTFMSEYLPLLLPRFSELEILAKHELQQLFNFHRCKRQTCLQKIDKPWSHLWLIEKGIACSEIPTSQGNVIREFYFPGQFVSNLNAYKINRQSRVQIKALTKLSYWSIHYSDVLYCLNTYQPAREIIEQFSCCYNEWQNELLLCMKSLTPKEHYLYLKDHFPQYFLLIKLRYLASYLKVSDATLYRLMSEDEDGE